MHLFDIMGYPLRIATSNLSLRFIIPRTDISMRKNQFQKLGTQLLTCVYNITGFMHMIHEQLETDDSVDDDDKDDQQCNVK